MRRPPRLDCVFDNLPPLFFVTFATHERKRLLATTEVHAAFKLFSHRAADFHVSVGRYVIMPDHVHLFVLIPAEGVTLEKWIRALRIVLGKCLTASGVKLPHWQETFFDHILRSHESYESKWEYVRQNPVRAGLCREPDHWPYQGQIAPIDFRSP